MREIEFKVEEKSRSNKVFIVLTYMSGDADAYECEENEILGVDFSNWKENVALIEEEYIFYSTVQKLLDKYDTGCKSNAYEEIVKEHGQEIADAYDQVPGDSTCDGQWPAALSDIELIGYDINGTKYKSYL